MYYESQILTNTQVINTDRERNSMNAMVAEEVLEVLENYILMQQEANDLTVKELEDDPMVQCIGRGFTEACEDIMRVVLGLKEQLKECGE